MRLFSFGTNAGSTVDQLRERALSARDRVRADAACRDLLGIDTPEAIAAVLDVVAAGRYSPLTADTPLVPQLEAIARRWSTATTEGRTGLAGLLVRTDGGRQVLRDLLGAAAAWTLRCDRCGAEVLTITKVPRLWPCDDGRGAFRVDPDGANLVVGDPVEGTALGHRSGEGRAGAAFDARDVATLARELTWGLRFICPEEPTVWCLDHVEVAFASDRTDFEDGWHRLVETHHAIYPDGHRREVARRTITDA